MFFRWDSSSANHCPLALTPLPSVDLFDAAATSGVFSRAKVWAASGKVLRAVVALPFGSWCGDAR